jgi:hypothetical protein
MGSGKGNGRNASLTDTEEIDAKVIEGLMIVFGIVVGSGFDTLLAFEGKSDEQSLIGALLYGMGISVVARLSLGGALHLHIEYGVNPTWTDRLGRRRALFWDIAFFVAYAMILRYAAALGTSKSFFVGQMAMFSVAFGWSLIDERVVKKRWEHWGFWKKIDLGNLVVAAIAFGLLHFAKLADEGVKELLVLGLVSLCYLALGACELCCLLATADKAQQKKVRWDEGAKLRAAQDHASR